MSNPTDNNTWSMPVGDLPNLNPTDLDSLLTKFMNAACDYEGGIKVDLDAEFDATKAAISAIIARERLDEAHIGLANNEGSQAKQLDRIAQLKAEAAQKGEQE
jgi:hypothetical protein